MYSLSSLLLTSPGVYNYTTTPNYIEVLLGSVKRVRVPPPPGIKLQADFITHHPNLTWTGLGPIYWDVALVRLERPITFSSYIWPICLPEMADSFTSDNTCYLAGWGYIGHNQGRYNKFTSLHDRIIIMLRDSLLNFAGHP